MNKPIVTGILSYGMSGRVFHAPFIHANANFELRAVTERSNKTIQERYADVTSYNSVDELLKDPEIELVIVNTPNNTHYEYAKKALLAGKHVLVEKPFAATSAEARELFQLGKERNLKVLVYQNRRWDSDFLSVKSALDSGKLGDPIEVHFRFDRYRNEISKKAFKELPLPASGLTYDLGPHLLDQVISIWGKPASFVKTTGIFRSESQVDDYMHVHLRYESGLNVFVTASLLTASPLPSFVVHGTRGSYIKSRTDVQEDQLQAGVTPDSPEYGVEKDGNEGMLVSINEHGVRSTEHITALKGNYDRLFSAVHDTIRKDLPFPVSEEDILSQIQILEAK